jgi:transcriptional regulator with XRE-family HTH domain
MYKLQVNSSLYRQSACILYKRGYTTGMHSGPEQLKDWMRRRGFNQADAARYFGFDQPTMTRIVNGTYRPGLLTAIKIEELAGIPAKAWVDASALESEPEPVTASGAKRRIVK